MIAAVEVLRRPVRGTLSTSRKLARLADDLLGKPVRPGLPNGRPGLMARVGQSSGGWTRWRSYAPAVVGRSKTRWTEPSGPPAPTTPGRG